jgi:hypothetical protein
MVCTGSIWRRIRKCSLLKVNRRFGGTCCLRSTACYLLHAGFLVCSTVKVEVTCSSKRRLALKGLHGVTFQKLELFITIAVRTTNPISRVQNRDCGRQRVGLKSFKSVERGHRREGRDVNFVCESWPGREQCSLAWVFKNEFVDSR